MMIDRWLPTTATIVVLVLAGGTASAQASESDEWEFFLAPYLWASGLDGRVTAKGSPTNVDASFSDIVDVLDGGGLIHFEAGKGRWALLSDAVYLDLSQDAEPVAGEAEVEQLILEVAAAYRVGKTADALFGLRYTSADAELSFQGPVSLNAKGDESWTDPFIGVRWFPRISNRWKLYLRADVGAFGDGSDTVWQFRTGANVKASEMISVMFGYRLLDYDYKDGSGPTLFEFDVELSGLEAGVGFRF